ncbi:MipA/OmpV family protein [Motilimonas cestriensis]|uniref:MipA/OmpV family protein n=1 Tax=Motilimonas cestriensis TaxID=2742685 RepID=UPI003DA4210C
MNINQWMVAGLFLLGMPMSFAHADKTAEKPVDEIGFWDEFRWDASVGAGLDLTDDFLYVKDEQKMSWFFDVNLSIEYKDFYLDIQRSNLPGGAVMGYHLWQGETWQADLVAGTYTLGFDENGNYYTKDGGPALQGIKSRNDDFNLGVKFFRDYDFADFSTEIVTDFGRSHQSWMVRSVLSRPIPAGNWDLRGGLGFDIYSAKMANYYYGVSDDEVSAVRPAYQPGLSFGGYGMFVAEYPLSESWVFYSAALIGVASDNIKQSPLTNSNVRVIGYLGVKYVF